MTPYYQDDQVTIYHGDCRDVLPSIAGMGVDLVFTSPPYNMGRSPSGNGRFYKPSRASNGRRFIDGYGSHEDDLEPEEYKRWQRSVLSLCWEVLEDDGAIFYNHKPRIQHGVVSLPLDFDFGLPVRQVLIWDRRQGINLGDRHYCVAAEWIVVMAKPGWRLPNRGASAVGDVWTTPYETKDYGHPAPFPVGLPRTALVTTGAKVVLDPFAGSGTTLRAAKDLGRRAIGIEIEERYCEIAANRMAQLSMSFG